MRIYSWLAASLLTALAGCGNGPSRVLYQGTDVPQVDASYVYYVQQNAGIGNITPGLSAGYYITNNGGAFRIVWTGDRASSGLTRHFTGSVWTQGSFTSETPGCVDGSCALLPDNYVSVVHDTASGQRIDWDTLSDSALEGFDFSVTMTPVYFYAMVDDQPREDLIEFISADTGYPASSACMPFGLVPQ